MDAVEFIKHIEETYQTLSTEQQMYFAISILLTIEIFVLIHYLVYKAVSKIIEHFKGKKNDKNKL